MQHLGTCVHRPRGDGPQVGRVEIDTDDRCAGADGGVHRGQRLRDDDVSAPVEEACGLEVALNGAGPLDPVPADRRDVDAHPLDEGARGLLPLLDETGVRRFVHVWCQCGERRALSHRLSW